MIKYVIKRFLLGLLVLFGVVVITFLVTRLLPSDPARTWAGAKATPEQLEAARVELGLDKPLYEQFGDYLSDLLHGDLGTSFTTKKPVAAEMAEKIPATLELVLFGTILGVTLGIILGVLSAKYKNRLVDHMIRFCTIGAVSFPGFVLALLLQFFFYGKLGIMPLGGRLGTMTSLLYDIPDITGILTLDCLLVGNFELFKEALWHLILPSIGIMFGSVGTVARMTRSALLEVLNEDYIMAGRSYGIKESTILWRNALKNTIGATATATALSIGYTLVNTFLVESIFNWPGIGSYMSDSVLSMNYPAIMGTTLFATIAYLLLNLIADLIVAVDPRVRV